MATTVTFTGRCPEVEVTHCPGKMPVVVLGDVRQGEPTESVAVTPVTTLEPFDA